MATKTKQQETKQERVYPESIFDLWKDKSKDGKITFLSNKTHVGFYNTKKQNPKEPDLVVYLKDSSGKAQKDAYCLLWCNLAKDGKTKYLTGYIKETKEKLLAFINDKHKNEKEPYLRIYWKAELDKYNSDKKAAKKETESKTNVPVDDNDLPF